MAALFTSGMASAVLVRACRATRNFLNESYDASIKQVRGKSVMNHPKLRYPTWLLKKERAAYPENLTPENKSFIDEVVRDRYTVPSPLREAPLSRGEWAPGVKRTGVIARKIGCYPMWLKDGSKINTTLLQVVDNHVVSYQPPGEFVMTDRPHRKRRPVKDTMKYGCLLVGAESTDPRNFTKEYCGLFSESGLMPKKVITRFYVSPQAAIQPGTPLHASHFQPGQFVDVSGKTIYRGFQGVMKRWGFSGMPASHGVTKTHRRPGNIGGGGEKGRVWPGTKMPGHMGNRLRTNRGLKVWRINTKYNVIWVQGFGVPGETNSIVHIYDTILPLRRLKEAPPFPTFYPEDMSEPQPEEIYADEVYQFGFPSIKFQ
ncbi:39S ribosomal protein L3, mitochondrial [Ischnura elegans]|uniref:39S ribosomal protein L3, mitochondrial n=1 Tax=Ischnura elegans TaxID=197161 RepID=UPI001ED8B01C|nr:39S ribosomal protein L3, mitochondrial [Ischnura elegans]